MEALKTIIESGYPPAIVVTVLCFTVYVKYFDKIKGKEAKIIIGLIAFIVIPIGTYYLTVQSTFIGIRTNKDYSVNSSTNNKKSLCERIQFSPGAIAKILQGKLFNEEEKCYKLRINAGEELIVNKNKNFNINIIAPGGEVIAPEFISEGIWMGEVPISGDYLMIVKGHGSYIIKVIIPVNNPTHMSQLKSSK